MKFLSTREGGGKGKTVSFSDAVDRGLAPDGGLFVPQVFPAFDQETFENIQSISELGSKVLRPFVEEDIPPSDLSRICKNALNFPIPVRVLSDRLAVLELFHGPTAAFKDVGARFLAEFMDSKKTVRKKRTVLVATSGDTGGAVASAFFKRPGTDVVILFPEGKVSARQEQQLTCWGGNVRAFAVRGSFDDCQRIVKEAFGDSKWREKKALVSANSINIGRLLPQMIYYAMSSLAYFRRTRRKPGFVIPSGNLGNSVAALWAKRVGFPIRNVVLACNANRSVVEYFKTGKWNPKKTVHTLANAMDVGNPSNMERLTHLYPSVEAARKDVCAFSVTDTQIQEAIREERDPICPHTATAFFTWSHFLEKDLDWVLVATAHPAKFDTRIELPPSLTSLFSRPSKFTSIRPTLAALKEELE